MATPVWTRSKTIVSFSKLYKYALHKGIFPSTGKITGSPFTIFIFSWSVYFSFWIGLSNGLNVILISFSFFGKIVSFKGVILNAFSLFSSNCISAGAFPPLYNLIFCDNISTLSLSILSYLKTNLFKVFWISNFVIMISAHTLNLKECI